MRDTFPICNNIDLETLHSNFSKSIISNELPSYVYTYPLRQSYRPLDIIHNEEFIQHSLTKTPDNFNLYIHLPFCNQICNFCNLFSVANYETMIDEYIETLSLELDYYIGLIGNQDVKTIYFGGGTPSLLTAPQFERVFRIIERYFPNYKETCVELCLEVDPSTIDYNKAIFLKQIGFNRVNIGVQSFKDNEIHNIGRKYGVETCNNAIDIFKEIGIDNICVDLINGIQDQTFDDWSKSVDYALSFHPETMCIYSLVIRPTTPFYSKRDSFPNSAERYRRYDVAYEKLINKGYQQETNVRFIQPQKGGYKQIEYHWKGATVLGIGAGARTYSSDIHYINGYSTTRRRQVLHDHIEQVKIKGHNRTDGYVLDTEEQIRREFALNLHNMNYELFYKKYGIHCSECFPSEINMLINEGCLINNGMNFSFSRKGFKYRDLISQLFFSPKVNNLFKEYTYE